MHKRKLESWPRGITKRIRGVREKESKREREREKWREGGQRGKREEGERKGVSRNN